MVVSTDKKIAVLIHQARGTGKCWKPVQTMTLDEKNLFHIAVCFGRILCPKGAIQPLREMVERFGRIESRVPGDRVLYPAVSTLTRVRILVPKGVH